MFLNSIHIFNHNLLLVSDKSSNSGILPFVSFVIAAIAMSPVCMALWFHASANGVAFTTAAELELVSRSDSGRTSEWRDTGRSDVVELHSIL